MGQRESHRRYLYDASKIAGASSWPEPNQKGSWSYALAGLRTVENGKRPEIICGFYWELVQYSDHPEADDEE